MTTFASNRCLGYNGMGLSVPGMEVCDGSNGQQLKLPVSWFPDITTAALNQVRLSSDNAMCMEVSDSMGGETVLFASCQDNIGRQIFTYDASTHQIKQQNDIGTVLCLTTDDGSDNGSTNVSMEPCISSGRQVRMTPLVCVQIQNSSMLTNDCLVLALQSEHPPAQYF